MANPSGSRTHANAQVFDVKVLAFPAATPHTVQGLMQLFNIDQASAERLIGDVPLLLNQQVTGDEAEACAQALRKLGARVVVEPAALPTAHQARWSQQPSSFEEDLLPQVRAMPVANDTELEYDVLSDQDTGYVAHQSISTSLRDGLDMDLGSHESDLMANDSALRRSRQESIDLQSETTSPDLELAAPAVAREKKASREVERPRARPPKQEAPAQPAARPRPADGASPHGRAATVQHAPKAQNATRTLPLLQVLFAFAVAAIGYWADSSVIFGNASLWSVIAHGAALYQLILGVRGLAS